MSFVLLTLVAASGCSAYDRYMADGCDGLRQLHDAYVSGDRQALSIVNTGSFDPAYEETGGDSSRTRAIDQALDAEKAMLQAIYTQLDYGEVLKTWKPLTPRQQQQVDAGLAACSDF